MLRRSVFVVLLILGFAACGDDDQPLTDAGDLPGEDGGVDDDGGADVDAGGEDCLNGEDDDGDDAVDCDDSDCAAAPNCVPEADCNDDLDNDLDGAVDCADSDCDGVDGCELDVELSCNDDLDNDGDADTDCADSDCAAAPSCVPEDICDDEDDNDLDGDIDCDDSDCAEAANCVPEVECDDGFDNDFDDATDCEDSDCVEALTCIPEAACDDGLDNDLDEAFDCDDSDCAAACATSCPSTSTAITISATDLPKAFGPSLTSTELAVVQGGVVSAVAVRVNVTHTWDSDVGLGLEAPDGLLVTLSTGNGSSDDNYTDTLFVDTADTAITAGTAPFTGPFRPEEPLSGFAEGLATGTWTFYAADIAPTEEDGTLDGVDLYLCVCTGTDCEIGRACRDGVDDDGDLLVDCADADCAAAPNCVPEAVCDDGLDDDFDGDIDCADEDCDGIGICELPEVSCDDGGDNDGDGDVDCDDADCDLATYCVPEVDCNDDLDNDLDDLIDCLDPGCDGVGFCEIGVELSCDDDNDNDGDGTVDCADTDCTNQLICVVTSCPPGSSLEIYTATDVPVTLLDPGQAVSTLTIPDLGLVEVAAVRIGISHTYDADLDIVLDAPGGNVALSTDNGGTADNYTETTFLDSAAASIMTGTAPFTGAWRPEEPLSVLFGTALEGVWTLEVNDQFSDDTGTIDTFQVGICACDAASGECELGPACRDALDNDGDDAVDCDDENCATDPSCIPEPICDNEVDDDLDGDADCLDADCDGIAGCELGTEVSCGDGFDNDTDGDVDCFDSDCAASSDCVPEVDCGDTIDNDDDGEADCADQGCNGVSGCTFGVENACSDLVDNDGNGLLDAADPMCAWAAAALPACTTLLVYQASDLPQSIPLTGPPNVHSSFIPLAGAGTVGSMAVRINITHTWDSDLDILVFSPTGTSRELATGVGTNQDNFISTVFADSAAGVIGTTGFNTAPFTGSYQPEQPLSLLTGETITGPWELRVTDKFTGDGGTMNEFSLGLCLQP